MTKSIKKLAVVLLAVFIVTALFALTACKDNFLEGIENVPQGQMEFDFHLDGNSRASTNPYISWTEQVDAEQYLVQLSDKEDFSALTESKTVTAPTTTVKRTLEHNTIYYVRVFAMRNVDGKVYAFAQNSSSFTTIAVHDTAAPDYSVTRTIFDFEDYTTESISELFPKNDSGDEMTCEIAEGAGANGSKGLKLNYTKGDFGWGALMCNMLPRDKKVWSGTNGIRMWVKAGSKEGATFSIKVGKRGYQTWAAKFVIKNPDGVYVTIPYSVMEDQGGGDGLWDLSGMIRMQFTITGSNSTIYIDDITIGSDEEHSVDTRALAAEGPQAGLLENFEDVDVATLIGANGRIKAQYMNDIAIVENDGGHAMQFTTQVSSAFFQMQNAAYGLGGYGYGKVTGFTMKVKLSKVNADTDIRVKFGSYLNIYIGEYAINQADTVITVKIPFADFVLDEATSSGDLDFTKVNTLQIFFRNAAGATITVDDVGFYSE